MNNIERQFLAGVLTSLNDQVKSASLMDKLLHRNTDPTGTRVTRDAVGAVGGAAAGGGAAMALDTTAQRARALISKLPSLSANHTSWNSPVGGGSSSTYTAWKQRGGLVNRGQGPKDVTENVFRTLQRRGRFLGNVASEGGGRMGLAALLGGAAGLGGMEAYHHMKQR